MKRIQHMLLFLSATVGIISAYSLRGQNQKLTNMVFVQSYGGFYYYTALQPSFPWVCSTNLNTTCTLSTTLTVGNLNNNFRLQFPSENAWGHPYVHYLSPGSIYTGL
jgi:hypothetical protein